MNKRFFIVIAFTVLFTGGKSRLSAQTPTEVFLNRVAEQSFYVEAGRAEADARIAVTRSDNRPPDPEVGYEYLPGIEDTRGKQMSYGISQSIAWPGEYRARSQYNKLEREQAEVDFRDGRQEILLRTKLLVYDAVYARKLLEVYDAQKLNAERVLELTQKRFDQGDATAMDITNAKHNLLSVNSDWEECRTQLEIKRKQLEMIAGFDNFDIHAFEYIDNRNEDPQELMKEASAANLEIRTAQLESNKSQKNVSVVRGASMPSFNIGVAGERVTKEDSYLGVSTGITIPLWGGYGTVKAAKAQRVAAESRARTVQADVESDLLEQANIVRQLHNSLTQFETGSEIEQAVALLKKSFEQQQINVLEYFQNLTMYQNLIMDYLDREYRFYEALAVLTKFRL